jgi:GNAT superfamily N-acetyltransferase
MLLPAATAGVVLAASLVVRRRRLERLEWRKAEGAAGKARVEVRSGTQGDLGEIAALVRALARFEHSEDKVSTTAETLLRDAHLFETAVALRSDGTLVGFAFFSYGYSTWAGRTLALDDLFVAEPCRGQGIGSRLLAFVAERGVRAGANRMEWLSFRWNERANMFYTSRGATRQDALYYWRLSEKGMKLL